MKTTLPTFLIITLLIFVQNTNATAIMTETIKKAQSAMKTGDNKKAYQLYYRAATEGDNPFAQFMIGLFYQKGWGQKADASTACKWYEKAAKGGIPIAQQETGICFEQAIYFKEDPVTAATWYQKSAEGGHHLSLCYLGNLYMTGKGVPKNPEKALEICQTSAQQASPEAQVWMGRFFLKGDQTIRDYKQAYRWFDIAAQKKNPEALYYLGLIIGNNIFVGNTPEQALYKFEQAAALKYVPAYFPTGKLYFTAKPNEKTGYLSAENLAKAYLWLSAALKRSKDPVELAETKKMLKEILAVMPKTWLPELDHKVQHHLQENHPEPQIAQKKD